MVDGFAMDYPFVIYIPLLHAMVVEDTWTVGMRLT